MRLVLVGPGLAPIPPVGWGAVESLIWDYKIFLNKYHPTISVEIVNDYDYYVSINNINSFNPDIVHIHRDHIDIINGINCKNIIITTHNGYITNKNYLEDNYFKSMIPTYVNSNSYILSLNKSINNLFIKNGASKTYIQYNGANNELFKFKHSPLYPNRSIYLARICNTKKQYLYQYIPVLYFAGKQDDKRFYPDNPRYLGEWTKKYLYNNLTEYANLVLLSEAEAHPLVCCEALICGLGLVVSECASVNLDTSLPFIDVIPDSKLNDIGYVYSTIVKNQLKSIEMRDEIRYYGITKFGWKNIVNNYVKILNTISNDSDIAGFYQCYKQKKAFENSIYNFRKIYPNSTLNVYNDGGDASLEEIVKKYNGNYTYCNKISNGIALIFNNTNQIIEWILRLRECINKTKESYIMLVEDDVLVMKKTNKDSLKFDLNGCNYDVGYPDSINQYIMSKNNNMKDKKIFYGGCGGCILRTSFYRKIFENVEEIKSLINTYIELGGVNASDCILSFLTYITIVDEKNGTIGQYDGFAEKWYPNFDERMKNKDIEVLHQYKDLYE
jgi:glycosyltransferase involved in cell wall biosynthesis